MASNKVTVQVSDHRDGILHFQVGAAGSYYRIDVKKPKAYNLKGLKKNTSLYGSNTVYRVIPASAFKAKAAFKAAHGFSIGGDVEKAFKARIAAE